MQPKGDQHVYPADHQRVRTAGHAVAPVGVATNIRPPATADIQPLVPSLQWIDSSSAKPLTPLHPQHDSMQVCHLLC